MLLLMNYQVKQQFTLVQRAFMCFGAIRPKWRAFSEIGTKNFRLYYGHP